MDAIKMIAVPLGENGAGMTDIRWNFVLFGTLATVNLLTAVVDSLQGGLMWPCLGIVIAAQVLVALAFGIEPLPVSMPVITVSQPEVGK